MCVVSTTGLILKQFVTRFALYFLNPWRYLENVINAFMETVMVRYISSLMRPLVSWLAATAELNSGYGTVFGPART